MAIEKYLTPDEVADRLHVRRKTVLNWISARRIDSVEGRPPLISESAFNRFVRKRTRRAVV